MIKLTVLYGHPTDASIFEDYYVNTLLPLQSSMGSAEGQATAADLANFATGGVTLMVGAVEN